LKKQAQKDLDSVIINGELKDPVADIKTIVEASQALSLLEDLPTSDRVCKAIKKSQKQLLNDDTSASTLFYLTRLHNLYTCDSLSALASKVTDYLTTKVQTATSTSDIYYGH
jgi:hypothetical protein